MKKKLLTLYCLFILAASAFAQLAIVVDEGGFVNLYDQEKQELDRLGTHSVVAVLDTDDEWALIDYTKYDGYAGSSGYVKKDRIIYLSDYKELPLIDSTDNSVTLEAYNMIAYLTSKRFEKENFKITYFSEDNQIITAINDENYWGTRIGIPNTQYDVISVKIDDELVELPESALFNLFNPNLSLTKAYYDDEEDILYICAANGDASNPYSVVWVFEGNEYSVHYIFD